jgi:hypothetical protein
MRLTAAILAFAVGLSSSAEAQGWWQLGGFAYGYRHYYSGPKKNSVAKKARVSKAASKSDSSADANRFGVVMEGMIRVCNEQVLKFRTMRFDVVARTIQPIDDQRSAVDEVRAAALRAADALDSGCPKYIPAGPSARLEKLGQALEAISQSLAIMRPAFKPLYLFESSQPNADGDAYKFDDKSAVDGRPESAAGTLCYAWVATLRSWPTKLIESEVPLSDEQHARLHEVAATVYRAAGGVSSSCKPEDRLTALGRLNFVVTRLEILRQSVETIQPVISRFEDSLSVDGKKRLEEV